MDKKYTTIHYHSYLELDKILKAQTLRSASLDENPAHEEMLFIIIHQVYELWFKQMIHELKSVGELLGGEHTEERNLGVVNGRLNRVKEILRVVIKQIDVLETMTPLDFLDFRNYLFPASGFQSFQFRVFEVILGLKNDKRLTYHGQHYASVFPDEQKKELQDLEETSSVFEVIEAWLERTPFLQFKGFNFIEKYSEAVNRMLEKETKAIQDTDYLTDKTKEMRLQMLGSSQTYYKTILEPDVHNEAREKGEIRLSYKASVAALLINLYRDEPILHNPFILLRSLTEIDELVTTWRYRHAQMVLGMLGKKIGTGGSSGHEYLMKTAMQHQIFTDLHNISTLLIPRSELPDLPAEVKKELGFQFSS